jgi:hypothetical protein
MISAGLFPTLGVRPVLGRPFRSGDDHAGAGPVVILGGGFWRRKFGSSPDIIGKSLILNGGSYAGRPPLQTWRFGPLEIRVIAAKNEALQTLGIAKNVGWNAFALHFQEFDRSVSCAGEGESQNQTWPTPRSALWPSKRL